MLSIIEVFCFASYKSIYSSNSSVHNIAIRQNQEHAFECIIFFEHQVFKLGITKDGNG